MRDIPIVMLTAVGSRKAMLQGSVRAPMTYIAKSSDFDVLRARVLAPDSAQAVRGREPDAFANSFCARTGCHEAGRPRRSRSGAALVGGTRIQE